MRFIIKPFIAALALLFIASSLTAQAVPRIIAFGDSITTGRGDAGVVCPTSDAGGYTDRLRLRLESRGVEVVVENWGLCGERTASGVTRIDTVLARGGDVLVLMEGTNDFNAMPPVSAQAVRMMLNEMARKARAAGFVVVRASIIPRRADGGDNVDPAALANAVRSDARFAGDFFADPFNGLLSVPNLFTTLYFDALHLLPEGYEVLADIFDFPAYAAVQRTVLNDGGACFLPPGDPRFCTICSPCQEGQGDCDGDADCASGLRCVEDAGPDFGFGGGIDVCLASSGNPPPPPPGNPPPVEPPPGCPLAPGHPRLCTDCGPCAAGEGDCDRNSECLAGLVCTDNVGAQFGYAPGIDVCLASDTQPPVEPPPPGVCPLVAGHPRFCTDCAPCSAGQGDCDLDSECATGLVCTDNVGAQFGFAPGIDVCLAADGTPPTCPRPAGHPRFCTECGPCVSGEGDCDSDAECAAGLVCADNVGPAFGFGPNVDVCLAPQ